MGLAPHRTEANILSITALTQHICTPHLYWYHTTPHQSPGKKTHLLLSTFIARTLHRLPSLLLAHLAVLEILHTPWGALQPRHGDIALPGMSQAIGADRCMADSSHHGVDTSIIIVNKSSKNVVPLL